MTDNYSLLKTKKVCPNLIDTKTKYYEYAKTGVFGNQLRVWSTIEEFEASGYEGNLGLRFTGIGSRAPWLGNKIPAERAVDILEDFCSKNCYKKEEFAFCEAAPDHLLTIQGEVVEAPFGLQLRYSTEKLPMREAFKKEELNIGGAAATYLLRKHLSAGSYEDLQVLFESFPGHVVEFASFALPVGNLRGRNTIIWEVRRDGCPPGWYALERRCRDTSKDCVE